MNSTGISFQGFLYPAVADTPREAQRHTVKNLLMLQDDCIQDDIEITYVPLVDVASSDQVDVPAVNLVVTDVSVRRWMLVSGLRILDGTHESL